MLWVQIYQGCQLLQSVGHYLLSLRLVIVNVDTFAWVMLHVYGLIHHGKFVSVQSVIWSFRNTNNREMLTELVCDRLTLTEWSERHLVHKAADWVHLIGFQVLEFKQYRAQLVLHNLSQLVILWRMGIQDSECTCLLEYCGILPMEVLVINWVDCQSWLLNFAVDQLQELAWFKFHCILEAEEPCDFVDYMPYIALNLALHCKGNSILKDLVWNLQSQHGLE